MQNEPGSSSVTEPAARPTERRGIALITALFGVVVLGVMMSGMHFSSTQEYRGTRNALIEQRGFAVAEFGLNSEISNWDRSRNLLSNFAVGRIDSNQVYVAAGDTSWVKVSRLTENTFWVVSDGRASSPPASSISWTAARTSATTISRHAARRAPSSVWPIRASRPRARSRLPATCG